MSNFWSRTSQCSKTRSIGAVCLWFAFTLPVACASPSKLYPGERRDHSEVATIEMITNGAMLEINGHRMEAREAELLPGTTNVHVRVLIPGVEMHDSASLQRKTAYCSATLDLKAGHHYQITRSTPKAPLVRTGDPTRASDGPTRFFTLAVNVVERSPEGRRTGTQPTTCGLSQRHTRSVD